MPGQEYTIGQMATEFGLSRSTLLYYDRLGLLKPLTRRKGEDRIYSSTGHQRLERICAYRSMGVPLKEIAQLLGATDSPEEAILQQHWLRLAQEINRLQHQQTLVLKVLKKRESHANLDPRIGDPEMINKDRWVAIMRAAGFSEDDMMSWHRQFEKLEPEAHAEFLQSLGIDEREIAAIRARSQSD